MFEINKIPCHKGGWNLVRVGDSILEQRISLMLLTFQAFKVEIWFGINVRML